MFFSGFPILSYPIQPSVTTIIGYTKPYGNPSQSNLLSNRLQITIAFEPSTLPIKNWVYKSRLSFKVRQHGQQQLYFQYKVCWTLYKIMGTPSFSKLCLYIQQPLQSPSTMLSSTSVNFHLTFRLLFNKIILTIHFNTPFLYTTAFFPPPYFCVQPSQQSTPKMFSLLKPLTQFRLRQRTKELWSLVSIFNLSLFPQSMGSDSRAHNHWFLVVQTYKIGILQVVVSDEDVCNWNGKSSGPPSLTPSTYCHYFHTLLIPSQELTFLNLFKLFSILNLAFSYNNNALPHP